METSVDVLVDAKREYTNQLIQTIRPYLLGGMLSIYDEAFNVCQQNREADLTMLTFQELLGEIPKWNNKLVVEESDRIVHDSKCDYLEDLLTAVFVCHTKILTTIRVTNKDRKINLNVPCVENFVHQVYIEMAREFWKHPYLLNPIDVTKLEYQQNLKEAEKIIQQCLEITIRRLLPVKDILKEYGPTEGHTEDDVRDDEFTQKVAEHDTVSQIGGSLFSNNNAKALQQNDSKTEPNKKNTPIATTTTATGSISNTKNSLQNQLSSLTQNSDLKLEKESRPLLLSNPTAITSNTAASLPSRNSFDEALSKIENSLSSTPSSPLSNIKSVSTDKSKLTAQTQIGGSVATTTPIANSFTKNVQVGTPSSPVLSSSTTNLLSKPSSPITSLSLDSLVGGASSPHSSLKAPSSPTTSTSEISLDSLGSIEHVNVDFGAPSPRSSSSSIKNDVLGELNSIASLSVPPVVSAPAPAPAPAPFQFF